MQVIANLLPPAYVFKELRAVVAGGPVSAAFLWWGGGLVIVDLLLACWFFKRVYDHAVRTGILARYSAETLG
jgi:ABC-2 type transport system permease protein